MRDGSAKLVAGKTRERERIDRTNGLFAGTEPQSGCVMRDGSAKLVAGKTRERERELKG